MIRRTTVIFSILVASLVAMLWWPENSRAGHAVVEANQGRGGEPFDIKTLPVAGAFTVIDFYSPYCPPCIHVAPILENFAQKRPDVKIIKLNINRPEVKGIDWKSPLAQQHGLKSVPYFMIYDQQGKLMAQGKEATQILGRWVKEAGK
jgi:thiol-disulfide isomerase/thioredoxin